MLDPEAPEERREQIVAEARSRIEADGTLKHDTAWGMRKLAYEIRQRTEADYRFFRFRSEPPLLDSLGHELKIADGVLRFRIFNVDQRSPLIVPPQPTPSAGPAPRPPPPPRGAPPPGPPPPPPPPGRPRAPPRPPAGEGAGRGRPRRRAAAPRLQR